MLELAEMIIIYYKEISIVNNYMSIKNGRLNKINIYSNESFLHNIYRKFMIFAKEFIGLNDNQHNIIKIIKANKILDDDIKRVEKIANIKLFNRNSINNDRDWKQSEIKNEVLNYINNHIIKL